MSYSNYDDEITGQQVVKWGLKADSAKWPPSWLPSTSPPSIATQDLMSRIEYALRQLRELFHSHGRISSPNEALDEVAILLFAHAMGTQSDGVGISSGTLHSRTGLSAAQQLKNYVSQIVSEQMPASLAHEFGPHEFEIRLRPSENDLAQRIIALFEEMPLGTQADPLRADIMNEAFGRFLSHCFVDEKEFGQYLTPPEVVDFMVRLALSQITDDEMTALLSTNPASGYGYVLDPSCGVGSFLAEFIRVVHEEIVMGRNANDVLDWPAMAAKNLIVGIDKSERMMRLALANLALFGAPAARLHLANSLATRGATADSLQFLKGNVGLILTNPPFGATFTNGDLADYRLVNNWASRSPTRVDSELLFIERYLDWLRPGGQLLAIVPDSILTNKALYADLRRGIAPSIEICSVVSLPAVAFAAAGTTTKTSVLHLRRRPHTHIEARSTNFAICRDLGYTVSSRGAQRSKISQGKNELPELLMQLTGNNISPSVVQVRDATSHSRWDATYHASMSQNVLERLETSGIRVADVAELSSERRDPRRSGELTFKYIEISDVDGPSCTVTSKDVRASETPSRARQLVRAGDVLVSTVRPERRAIAVVPDWLDQAICTTGFAVLRPHSINGSLLAALLRSHFATEQLLRNNVGIAYPAIEPQCLLDVLLPLDSTSVGVLDSLATHLTELRAEVHAAQEKFDTEISYRVSGWLRQIPD